MPGKERCQNKEYFGPWLLRHLNNDVFEGARWLNEERTLFRLPWKHLNIRNVDEKDYAIFKAWAIQSRRYDPQCVDLPAYKTNFRCALKSVAYRDRKMFSDYKDNSLDQHDPHKIFRFNGVHEDCSSGLLGVSNSPSALEEQNLQNDIEHDEDYRLRTSPDVSCDYPFSGHQEDAAIEELLREFNLGSDGGTSTLDLSQRDYAHEIPRVDHIFRQTPQEPSFSLEQPCLIGHEQPLVVAPNGHDAFYSLGSHYQGYGQYSNGYVESAPEVQQNYVYTEMQPHICNGLVTIPEAQVCQNGPQQHSTQQMAVINDVPAHANCVNPTDMAGYATSSSMGQVLQTLNENESAQEILVPVHHQERRTTKLTSLEITISYRGKEVLKQNVSKRCYITQTGHIPDTGAVDLVHFPSTDTLLGEKQIEYTNAILNSVGDGLLLDVNPNDFKLYAIRMGNARVYWSMSESLKTKENANQSKKLERNVPTGIFDFSQFWQELKDYRNHRRSSPDYTIYLSFGHYLFEPVNKALVLVKLVPNFCTLWHQVAQEEGASSLHTEQISLQISNGSSFNNFEGPCLMDMDISDFSYLF